MTLDTSETLFSVLAAINTCGYNAELDSSDPVRVQIRAEVANASQAFDQAKEETLLLCQFYHDHEQPEPSRTLSQYVSLALRLEAPPGFAFKVKDADLPPDAAQVAGIVPILQKFYDVAGLHAIWLRHQVVYSGLSARYHDPLSKVLFDTEIYLRLQSAGYLGHSFTVYLDPMGAPGQTNARNYGADYYVVLFPSPDQNSQDPLKMPQIRHAYLHYLLDPMAAKHFSSIKRVEPLLQSVKRAPLEENFRSDISLLVTECLVRAIEIRTTRTKQTAEAMRLQAVDDAVKQGYILTHYFYNALLAFEKDPAGLRAEYAAILDNIDLKAQQKAASEIQFAQVSAPELVQLSRMEDRRMLVTAEKRLAAGDPKGAQELAQQALDRKIGDQGRALFILAQVAVANKNRESALANFQKAIEATKDPKVVAWSHVYLGRILDMKEDREAAMDEYRAALTTGAELPEVKAAAERGLQQAYEPPAKPQQ